MNKIQKFPILCVLTILSVLCNCAAESVRLKNGINIYLEEQNTSPLTSIQIWVAVGSVDEPLELSGISHFIEHTIFKGTKTRGRNDIAPAIERKGGVMNAATSKDFTYFYALVPEQHCTETLDIISDAILNPEFPQEEIDKERLVVLEEISRRDDMPVAVLSNEFYSLIYGTNPYSARILGSSGVITSLSREKILDFHKSYYTPDKIFIVLTGKFNSKSVLAQITKYFGALKYQKTGSKTSNANVSFLPDINSSSRSKIFYKNVSQTYMIMGFPAADIKSNDQYKLDVLSYIIGHGKACRLNKKFVEENKLAYAVSASFSTHRGPGLFSIYTECPPGNADTLRNRIMLELLELPSSITEEELSRAKTLLLRDKLLDRQTPDGLADEIGFYAALGNPDITTRYIKEIQKVGIHDIGEIIDKYFSFPNLPTVIVTYEDF
ncbi:MAG: Protease 3 precursor [Elusimicrobia bacterium ADurb.Bin231]|nr:MAG: Protease 3 precursor [Elusimicrobia bacterium ADurb.Bin231]